VPEPDEHGLGREDPHPCGRQLDRQGQAVEPHADLGDRRGILVRDVEVRLDGAGALDEQGDGLELAELRERRQIGRVGQPERRNRVLLLARHVQDASAAHEDGKRRAAGQQGADSGSRIGHLLEVVEHQEDAFVADVVDEAIGRRPAASVGEPEGLGHRARHEVGRGDRRELDEEDSVGVVRECPTGNLEAEPRLPGPSRTCERQEPAAGQELLDLLDLAVPAQEARHAGRQVVRNRIQRRDRRKRGLQPRDHELPQSFRAIQVPEPMLPEVTQLDAFRQAILDQHPGRIGEEHLPAMADAGDAAGPMHMEADISVRADAGLAGVETHADPHRDVGRPWLGGEPALRGRGGGHRPGSGGEGDEERVPLGADLHAVLGGEGRPQDLLVASEDGRPAVALLLEETGRPFDIGEEERDRSGEKLGHRPECAMPGRCGTRPRRLG
jgi:hypothetical protein